MLEFIDSAFGSHHGAGSINTEHLPNYTSVNADIAKSFKFGSGLGALETRLTLVNLFDHIYQLRDGTGIGVGAPQYGQRRSVYVSVSKAF